jgi:ATP-binding cassette subfamily C protein
MGDPTPGYEVPTAKVGLTVLPPASLLRSAAALAADAYHTLGIRLVLLFIATLASAICEGLVFAMLLPLFGTMGFAATSGSATGITSAIERVFAAIDMPLNASSVGALLLALVAVAAAIFLLQAFLATQLQAQYVAHWQRRLFAAVIGAGWPFLRRQRGADIVGALTTESIRLGGAFYQLNLIVTSATFLVMQVAVAAVIAPAVVVAMSLLAVVLFAVTRQMVRRALDLGSQLTVANADLLASASETMDAMKLIKATARETLAERRLSCRVDRIEKLSFRNNFDVQIVRGIFEYGSAAALAMLLLGGPLLLGIDVISVLIVVAIFIRLFPKVTGLRQCVQSIGVALPAYDILRSIAERTDAAQEPSDPPNGAGREGPADLLLEQVSVRGEGGEKVLDQLSLGVPAGAFVAIVGPTGAGKTTLIDCVLGLVKPTSGEVLIDGMPLPRLGLRQWRHSVGYLGQHPVLLSSTVRENISWGRAGVDDGALLAALDAADASFVLRLPQRLDTDLQHWGSRLSGGERQRIALARALLGTPRLLILDEATSALDVETERRIIDGLRRRRGATTILAITHRLAVVRSADLTVMLERGRIIEQGTFAQLQAARGRFAAFSSAELNDTDIPGLAAAS